jgi:hypothetical protein
LARDRRLFSYGVGTGMPQTGTLRQWIVPLADGPHRLGLALDPASYDRPRAIYWDGDELPIKVPAGLVRSTTIDMQFDVADRVGNLTATLNVPPVANRIRAVGRRIAPAFLVGLLFGPGAAGGFVGATDQGLRWRSEITLAGAELESLPNEIAGGWPTTGERGIAVHLTGGPRGAGWDAGADAFAGWGRSRRWTGGLAASVRAVHLLLTQRLGAKSRQNQISYVGPGGQTIVALNTYWGQLEFVTKVLDGAGGDLGALKANAAAAGLETLGLGNHGTVITLPQETDKLASLLALLGEELKAIAIA